MVRSIISNMALVHVDCTAEECARRDVKGMWAKAKAGEIKGFTGFDAPFESPEDADLVLKTASTSVEEDVQTIINHFGL